MSILFFHASVCDCITLQSSHIGIHKHDYHYFLFFYFFTFLFSRSNVFFSTPFHIRAPTFPFPASLSFRIFDYLLLLNHIELDSYCPFDINSPFCFHLLFSFPFLFMMFSYIPFHSLVFFVIFLFYSITTP